ncbi:MAG TPA: phage portal protein [Desulfohalobiaceae bacterium]|nr:phage portal protein [Desulfohalobiaceae bacterium]
MDLRTFTKHDLEKTSDLYQVFISDWLKAGLAYRSGQAFINSVLFQYPAETDDNYTRRKQEAFSFGYSRAVVHIYNFFLTEKSAILEVDDEIVDREDWQSFQSDCDLWGSPFEEWIEDKQKLTGVYGGIGILVDQYTGEFAEDEARPYLSAYTPNNILDWRYERDLSSGKPELTYLKLRESSKVYILWTKTQWAKYQLSEETGEISEVVSGENRLGEIPFVWFKNISSETVPYLGTSDITDVVKIDGAIIRAFSMGSESLKFAGFPILSIPMEKDDGLADDSDEEIIISESSVLEHDPEAGSAAKASWIKTEVGESIDAVLNFTDRITEEMFRCLHLSALHNNRDKAQSKSGTNLRYAFQVLNTVLIKKSKNLNKAEKEIYKFFGMWQEIENIDQKIQVSRISDFSIDEMAAEITNMISSIETVVSEHFQIKQQLKLAKYTNQSLSEKDLSIMKKEITANIERTKNLEQAETTTELAANIARAKELKQAKDATETMFSV